MISLYTCNAVSKWDTIDVIIWGASTKLAGEDEDVQKGIIKMLDKGIVIEACKACTDKLKVSDKLKYLGVTVKYMSGLTGYLKSDNRFITI